MRTNWKERSGADKAMLIFRIAASLGVIVLAALQLLGIWERAMHVAAPLIGLILLAQSIQEWKQSRGVAIFGLCAALFLFGCAFVVWFVK